MSGRDSSEAPSGFLLGREFIIVLVIVFSGLSFTLGFFVGKNSAPDARMPMQGEEKTGRPRQDNRPVQPEERAETVPSVPIQPMQSIPQVQPTQPVQQAEQQLKETGSSRAVDRPPVQSQKTDMHSPPPKQDRRADAAEQSDELNPSYTVQVGAFKNPAEARQLKARFEKKGYKTFISMVKDAKGNKVYKVRTGEFTEKKEAEVLALKLKKTEDLNTYVTTRTD